MGPWEAHGPKTGGFYTCNRYDPSKAPKDGKGSKAKAELDRYLHYYKRYAGHEQAGKFATKLRRVTQRRIRQIQENATGEWVDAEFLANATEVVIECRRVLKYTYTLCYYMPDGAEKSLLEHQQEMLERYTEGLAEITEKPDGDVDRADVNNYSRVTQNFVQQILSGVESGVTDGFYSATGAGAGASAGAGAGAGAGAAEAAGGKARRRK